jgi:hypothetical protein
MGSRVYACVPAGPDRPSIFPWEVGGPPRGHASAELIRHGTKISGCLDR